MEFNLVAATEDDRPVLRRLVELYRYDFSEFDQADVDLHGEYGYRYLSRCLAPGLRTEASGPEIELSYRVLHPDQPGAIFGR